MLTKKSSIPKRSLALLIGDLIVLSASPWLVLGSPIFQGMGYEFAMTDYAYGWGISSGGMLLFVFCFHLYGLYDFRQNFRNKKNVLKVFMAVLSASVLCVFIAYLFRIQFNSRWAYFYFSGCVFFGVLFVRLLYSIVGSPNQYSQKVVIVGNKPMGREIADKINQQELGWMTLCAFIDTDIQECQDAGENKREMAGVPVFPLSGSLRQSVAKIKPNVLILALEKNEISHYIADIIQCGRSGIKVWDMATAWERVVGRIPLDFIDDQWLLFAVLNGPDETTWRLKRLIDTVVSGVGLVVTAPLMLVSCLAVLMESGRPMIIVQKRIGKNGRVFDMYKIRTMTTIAPSPGETGSNCITHQVTRVGRILRKLHFDEFPQFINILRGDLSLVGPRSELFDFVYHYINQDRFREVYPDVCWLFKPPDNSMNSRDIDTRFQHYVPYIEQRFTVPQGITGWAQVHAPHVSSSYDDMIRKLEYDLYYIKNLSLILDFEIFIRTIKVMLLGFGK